MNLTDHTPRVMFTIAAGALMAGCLGDTPVPTSPERAEAIMHCPESFDENGWYILGVESVSWVNGMCQVECDQGLHPLRGGVLPTVDDAVASLSSDTYHLAPDEVELGRGVLLSHVETMTQGLAPPLEVAVEVLAWLRAHAPDAIVGRVLA